MEIIESKVQKIGDKSWWCEEDPKYLKNYSEPNQNLPNWRHSCYPKTWTEKIIPNVFCNFNSEDQIILMFENHPKWLCLPKSHNQARIQRNNSGLGCSYLIESFWQYWAIFGALLFFLFLVCIVIGDGFTNHWRTKKIICLVPIILYINFNLDLMF